MIELENVFDDFCVVNLEFNEMIWAFYYSVYESSYGKM